MTSRVRRIAVLTADVGEGHLAAARVLAEQVNDVAPEVEVVFVDALEVLGRTLRIVLRDAYRFQLRRTPFVFQGLFWLFEHVRPLRALGRLLLSVLGARRLRRRLAAIDADVVVSTYPAATSVLGSLRRRGRIRTPALATITDFAGIPFWAHRGIDLHLVPHDSLVPSVEREAGAGSAVTVAPLAQKAFREIAGERAAARTFLNLPPTGRIVVVSGGGWGAGDIAGAVAEAAALPETTVVAATGRNGDLHSSLLATYRDRANVRVIGFTDAMPQLLAAADALVHTTGGVTCLEALTVGCPIVAYGAPAGHAPALARAMAKLEIAHHPTSPDELRACLTEPGAARTVRDAPEAGAQLLAARVRVQPPRRLRVRTVLAAATVVTLVAVMLGSSRTAFAVIRAPFEFGPTTVIATHQKAVGLVIETTPARLPEALRVLSRHKDHASFAFDRRPSLQTQQLLERRGDQWMIALGPSGLDDWVSTADVVQDAKAGSLVLAAQGGITTGQYVLTWLVGRRVVAPARRIEQGAVVLWSHGSLARVLDAVASRGLKAAPVGTLTS